MAVKIEVRYAKSFESGRDLASTFKYCSDFEKVIPEHFPGIEKFEKVDASSYNWIFERVKYGNYEIQIKLITRLTPKNNDCIEMTSIPKPGYSQISGAWKFKAQGQKTVVSFDAVLETELPIPFFLKAVAAPLTQKELSKVFDRYIANVAKALT